jgi:galactose mutarotase-like enzyme
LKTTIKNAYLSAIINSKGAELISLKTTNNREYMWEGNPAFWKNQSPVLFPIVGTLKNNSFYYNENQYQILRHGFARNMEFTLIERSENQAIFSLISTEESLKIYPFDFEFRMIYTLDKNQLIITYLVINNNDCIMPFSIGAHPAFALPQSFENYTLAFEHTETLTSYLLEDNLLSDTTTTVEMSDNKLPLTYSLFEKDALVFKKLQSKEITILENESPILKVQFNDFPHLGIWTLNNAPFICIEPWIGYADTTHTSGNILEKEGIRLLDAKKSFQCSFNIEIL